MSLQRWLRLGGLLGVVVVFAIAGIKIAEFLRFTQDKAVLADLQGVESDYRQRSITTPVVVSNSGDAGDVIGLASSDPGFPYNWVSLTRVGQDGQALALAGQITPRPCAELTRAIGGHFVQPAVTLYLRKHCRR